jgi:hypothetical protein
MLCLPKSEAHPAAAKSRETTFVARVTEIENGACCGRIYIAGRVDELNVIATLTRHTPFIFRDDNYHNLPKYPA